MRTYVVRLREDRPGETERGRLRGVVDDVATGQKTTFTSDVELLRALVPDEDSSGPLHDEEESS